LVTDVMLALQMYNASKKPDDRWKGFEGGGEFDPDAHYHIAFVWIMMAILGPYIIQFSSIINAYFIK
jgi:hypothetical protein